jgi:hypothetical protein
MLTIIGPDGPSMWLPLNRRLNSSRSINAKIMNSTNAIIDGIKVQQKMR